MTKNREKGKKILPQGNLSNILRAEKGDSHTGEAVEDEDEDEAEGGVGRRPIARPFVFLFRPTMAQH